MKCQFIDEKQFDLPLIPVDLLQEYEADDDIQDRKGQEHSPVEQDVLRREGIVAILQLGGGQLAYFMIDLLNGEHVLDLGDQRLRIFIIHRVQGGKENGRLLTVIVGDGTDGLYAPFADGDIGQLLADGIQRDDEVGKNQLNDQDKGHYGHGSHGGMHDAGDHETQHVRGISDEEHGDAQIQEEAAGDHAA